VIKDGERKEQGKIKREQVKIGKETAYLLKKGF